MSKRVSETNEHQAPPSEQDAQDPRPDVPDWHLRVADALAAICRHAQIDADQARLTAGLPLVNNDLPARSVVIAAARVGLGAELLSKSLKSLKGSDCPCLVLLKNGRVALVSEIAGQTLTLRTTAGAQKVDRKSVGQDALGEVAVFHIKADALGPEDSETLQEDHSVFAVAKRFFSQKSVWAQLLIAGVIINLTALVLPLFLMAVYDRVVPNLAMETLWALGLGVLIAIGFEFCLKLVRQALVETAALRIAIELNHRVANHILRARYEHAPRTAGMTLSGIKEVDTVTNLIPSAVIAAFIDLPFFFLVLAIIYSIGGPVAAAPLAGAVLLGLTGALANMGLVGASKRGAKYQDAKQNLLNDIVEGLSHIKISVGEGQFLRHWNVIGDEAAMASKSVRFWAAFPSHASSLIMQLVTISVIVIGVLQLREGMMSVGAMVACTLLSNRAMVPISMLNGLVSRALQSMASFKAVLGLLKLPQEKAQSAAGVGASALRGDIRLVDVTLSHQDAPRPSLNAVSLSIEPGAKIALVGRSGAGKSTLLNVLAGLYAPQEGDVFIDGFHQRQYGANDLRRHIGFAPQSARLFNLSLKDNLLIGAGAVSSNNVVNALNISGLSQFVAASDEGLAMKLGPNGERLSGGQRQALLLARALVANPSILLLDEPTAALDSATEANVVRGLNAIMADKTMIISTHRTPLLGLVNRVIWMEDGQVRMDGPRDQVLAEIKGANVPQAQGA